MSDAVNLVKFGVRNWQNNDNTAEIKLFDPDGVTEIVTGYVVPMAQDIQVSHDANETIIRDAGGDIGIMSYNNEELTIQVTIIGADSTSEANAAKSLALPRSGGVAACRYFPVISIGAFGNDTVGALNTHTSDVTQFGTPQFVYRGGAQSVVVGDVLGWTLSLTRFEEITDPSGA